MNSDTITITGNITEPDLRHLADGTAVLGFKIGSSHRTFDKAQQKWTETSASWYSVSAFRGLAEHGAASLHRGDRVVVHGRLKLKEWENGSGGRGFAAEIVADSLGHDLLFGTSVYTKDGARGSDDSGTGDSATEPVQESWAVPGAAPEDEAPVEAAVVDSGDEAPESELALAGATAQTPF